MKNMKTQIFKLAAILLISAGGFTSCKDKVGHEFQNSYYVVGYLSPFVEIRDGAAKSRGYLFISENLNDTLFAINQDVSEDIYCGISILHDDIFSFPEKIMPENVCGLAFFPQEYRYAYKEQMTYMLNTEDWYQICNAMTIHSAIRAQRINITSISETQ